MANKIQTRRGTKAKLPTLSAGEPAFCTDTRELYIGTSSGNVNMGGSMWYKGTAMSGTVTTTGYYSYSTCPQVKVGDTYLNTSNGNVYECTTAGSGTTAKWTYKGCLKGVSGNDGNDGDDGVSISSIVQTTTSSADGGNNIITVTLSNGNKSTFTVKNGKQGSPGAKGADGSVKQMYEILFKFAAALVKNNTLKKSDIVRFLGEQANYVNGVSIDSSTMSVSDLTLRLGSYSDGDLKGYVYIPPQTKEYDTIMDQYNQYYYFEGTVNANEGAIIYLDYSTESGELIIAG